MISYVYMKANGERQGFTGDKIYLDGGCVVIVRSESKDDEKIRLRTSAIIQLQDGESVSEI